MLGQAMYGKLQEEVLETIPSVLTGWKTWKSRHPETTLAVLPKTGVVYRGKAHAAGRGYVVGLTSGGMSRAWNLADVRVPGVVNDSLNETSVLVAYDRTNETAVLYSRDLDGKQLVFEFRDGKLVDQATGSEWDPITGVALTAPMHGKRLKQLPGMILLAPAWKTFHPESTTWMPSSQKEE